VVAGRHHPESIEKRHVKGVADRRMECTPDRDGMAWVSLHLPGDTACAIWNRTTATARGLQGPNEPRTITQLRPDIAASLLLSTGNAMETNRNTTAPASEPVSNDEGPGNDDGTGTAAGSRAVREIGKVPTPRADVLVMVPVFSLLGATDEPAVLDGVGPIPASMARKLVADGAESFYRVLVDPRRRTLGDREGPLPASRDHQTLDQDARRQMHLPRLHQPHPRQRNRPPHRLGTRRNHRHHQPGTALPETSSTQTPQPMDTGSSHHERPTRLDLTHRPPLQTRTPRLRTHALATRNPAERCCCAHN